MHFQVRKKRAPPPPKESPLENLAGLWKSFSGVVAKRPAHHCYHRILSSVDPISFDKGKVLRGEAWCMASLSQ